MFSFLVGRSSNYDQLGLDSETGRWIQIDPKAEQFYDQNPYNSNFNNPIQNADPNGDCPICPALIGAAVGGGLDYAFQVGVNYATGNANPWTDVDKGSILISAGAGASGAGLIGGLNKLNKLRKLKRVKQAGEMVIDGTVNAVDQAIRNDGKVDLGEVGLTVTLGQKVRSPIRDKIKADAQNKVASKLKKLDKGIADLNRKLKNIPEKNKRVSRVNKRDNLIHQMKKTRSSVVKQGNRTGAAATGIIASSSAKKLKSLYDLITIDGKNNEKK